MERDSQKGIIIGHNGLALKQLGTRSRKAIETFLEHEVFLELWVKVRKGWRKSRDILHMIEHGGA